MTAGALGAGEVDAGVGADSLDMISNLDLESTHEWVGVVLGAKLELKLELLSDVKGGGD